MYQEGQDTYTTVQKSVVDFWKKYIVKYYNDLKCKAVYLAAITSVSHNPSETF